jgi:transposase
MKAVAISGLTLQFSRIIRHPPICASEWAHVEPLIPPAKRGGGRRRVDMRAVVNGVMYVLSTGCQWRYVPKEFPSRSTVNRTFVCGIWRSRAAEIARRHDHREM